MHKPRKKKPVYVTREPLTEHQVLEKAAEIVANRFRRGVQLKSPKDSMEYLTYKMAGYEREVFALLMLDSRHRVLDYRELFWGSLESASIHTREIVKVVLEANAASVILSHNHPSGDTEPSEADKRMTKRIVDALRLIEVAVLDHIIVGGRLADSN